MLKREKGFTLIELMIVVAIIGILAAIAIPKFVELLCKSKDGAMAGDLGAVRSAVVLYYSQAEKYPGSTATGRTLIQDLDEADILSARRFPLCKPGQAGDPGVAAAVSTVEYVADGALGAAEGGWCYDSNGGIVYPDYNDIDCVELKYYSVY